MQTVVAFAAAALVVMIGALMNAPAPPPEVAPELVVAVAPMAPTPAEAPKPPGADGNAAPSGG